MTGLSGSASGCHCTPSTHAPSADSIASGSPSSTARAVTRSPSPTASMAWWWWDATRCAALADRQERP